MGKQPKTGQKKTKEAIAKAAAASKNKAKKKWSKGKQKDKLVRDVYITKQVLSNAEKSLPKMNTITLNSVMEKFNVIGGVAKTLINVMLEKEKIKPVGHQCSSFPLYTGVNYVKGAVEVEKKKKK